MSKFACHCSIIVNFNDIFTFVLVNFVVGETILSPLVMCGPHGLKFNVPVELRLPHCASITPDRWNFALKSRDDGMKINAI